MLNHHVVVTRSQECVLFELHDNYSNFKRMLPCVRARGISSVKFEQNLVSKKVSMSLCGSSVAYALIVVFTQLEIFVVCIGN